jgi:hypothetical protein
MPVQGWEATAGYQFAKDFAGTIATVFASFTALWVTWYFSGKQAKIAEMQARTAEAQKEVASSQRDITYDKLKFDLFDRRYAIYVTAKRLIEHVSQKDITSAEGIDFKLGEMSAQVAEASFFFPQREVAIFTDIARLGAIFESARLGYYFGSKAGTFEDFERTVIEARSELSKIYEKLPTLLESELGFDQLRTPGYR